MVSAYAGVTAAQPAAPKPVNISQYAEQLRRSNGGSGYVPAGQVIARIAQESGSSAALRRAGAYDHRPLFSNRSYPASSASASSEKKDTQKVTGTQQAVQQAPIRAVSGGKQVAASIDDQIEVLKAGVGHFAGGLYDDYKFSQFCAQQGYDARVCDLLQLTVTCVHAAQVKDRKEIQDALAQYGGLGTLVGNYVSTVLTHQDIDKKHPQVGDVAQRRLSTIAAGMPGNIAFIESLEQRVV